MVKSAAPIFATFCHILKMIVLCESFGYGHQVLSVYNHQRKENHTIFVNIADVQFSSLHTALHRLDS